MGDILRLTSEFSANVNQDRPRPSLSLNQLLDTVPAVLHARLKSKDGGDALVDADVGQYHQPSYPTGQPASFAVPHTVSYAILSCACRPF